MVNTACPPASLFGSQQDQKPDNHLEWPNHQHTLIMLTLQLYSLREVITQPLLVVQSRHKVITVKVVAHKMTSLYTHTLYVVMPDSFFFEYNIAARDP